MSEAAYGEIVVKRNLEALVEVRRFVRLTLGRWGGMDDYVPCLVATELVTTSVRYATVGDDVTVRMSCTGDGALWLEVQDADCDMPRAQKAELTGESGRGPFFMERFTRCWGVRPLADDAGKVVFAVVGP